MKIQFLNVQQGGRKSNPYPLIGFYSKLLPDMGFTPGVLVQAIPEPGGFTFYLCDENISKYSVLADNTEKQGGKLIHVYLSGDAREQRLGSCALVISGQPVFNAALSSGDNLIACFDYGVIKVRKLPDGAKFGTVKPNRYAKRKKSVPSIHLMGDWLEACGFIPGAIAVVTVCPGGISLQLREGGIDNIQAFRVWFLKYSSFLEIHGDCLGEAGFYPDDIYMAFYENGLIKIQKPDFARFGF